MNIHLARIISGFILLILGVFLTFKPRLTYEKEEISDIVAVVGIMLMIFGIVILLSPLIR